MKDKGRRRINFDDQAYITSDLSANEFEITIHYINPLGIRSRQVRQYADTPSRGAAIKSILSNGITVVEGGLVSLIPPHQITGITYASPQLSSSRAQGAEVVPQVSDSLPHQ